MICIFLINFHFYVQLFFFPINYFMLAVDFQLYIVYFNPIPKLLLRIDICSIIYDL